MSRAADPPPTGLRERKKARTRATIQHEALELIRRQGYPATTVQQICAAAEVSESTFFRYFPTKEDVVLSDDFDPVIAANFRAQPPDVGVVAALRAAIRSVGDALTPDEAADLRERTLLAWQVPELRAAVLVQFTDTLEMLGELIAERRHRDPADAEVRVLAGALIGAMIAQQGGWAEQRDVNPLASVDEALALLEAGLPLARETG